ncbi:MAG: hypothetical protein IPP64_16615 [Bacteroidetes bacterium]|nr:hypothetical protein [Bacteroidota bacterium]
MDKSSIRKEIAALINSIKEHSDNIGDKEHIPQLELELILHKIEKLYQKSIVFNHLNTFPDKITTSPKSEPIAEKPIVEAAKVEIKTEAIKPAPISEKPIDLFGSEIPPVTEKPKQEKKIEKPIEKPIEKIVPSNKIQKPSIQDLTKAIGLNDKFLFANELFEGSMQEYNIAIQQLNGAGSLESAMDYFSTLQQLYEWDMEKETIKQLLDLVDRRYS